ncbi:MAG: sigma-54 dependent transcriptional regulator [Planctomycetota bacterium]|nr:sigma-54 dependent transcriptional regulator [Planctomycetota bacterium]
MGTILVVDDERGVLRAFDKMLSELGHRVLTASNANLALEHVREQQPDVVVTDLCMPGADGLETFRQIRAINAKLPVIIMTGQGTMDTAIEATKLGAFDYQLKPFDPESMVAAIERAMEGVRLMRRNVELNPRESAGSADAIIGDSPAMQDVFKAIGRVAATDATVLIRGESGTGKELVARAVYQHSLRAEAPLLVVNCAAIPDALLESELFGHERGAFTGAQARRIGKFQQAHGGTVFLDEIGDISIVVQAKILRLLQQKTLERVGSNETIQVDVRVLAATNRDLEQAISTGSFRQDLYHRLNVVTIAIRPLRERSSDIPKLVDYFIARYSRELKIDRPLVSGDALDALRSCEWPGNVRELEHCLYRTLIFTRGYPIQASDIARARAVIEDTGRSADPEEKALRDVVRRHLDSHSGEGTHERLLGKVERLLIVEALDRTSGNQTHAAQLLGLTRPTLHAKMQRYGIEPSKN